MNGQQCYDEMIREKADIQRLNDRFARYIQRVREIPTRTAVSADSGLLGMVQSLEAEVHGLKDTCGAELDRLRRDLEECCRLRAEEKLNQDKLRKCIADLQNQLEIERRAKAELQSRLDACCSQLADARAELSRAKAEASRPSPEVANLQQEVERLRRAPINDRSPQLEKELADKTARLCTLQKELDYLKGAVAKENDDLRRRSDMAASTISDLERKLAAKPTTIRDNSADLAAMLERAKQQAADDYRRITQDSEAKFTATINDLRRQLEGDNGVNAVRAENEQLRRCIDDLRAQIARLDGQLKACCEEKDALKRALEEERARASANATNQQREFQNLQSTLDGKLCELSQMRQECVPLRAEIESYKALLDHEEARLNSMPPAAAAPVVQNVQSKPATYASSGYQTSRTYKASGDLGSNSARGYRGDPCAVNTYSTDPCAKYGTATYSRPSTTGVGGTKTFESYKAAYGRPTTTFPRLERPPAPRNGSGGACCGGCASGGVCASGSRGAGTRFY